MNLNKLTVLAVVLNTFPTVDAEKVRMAFDAMVGRLAQKEKGKESWSLALREATKKKGVTAKVTDRRTGQSGMTADVVAFCWAMRAAEAAEAGYGSLTPDEEVRDWFSKFEPKPEPQPEPQQS